MPKYRFSVSEVVQEDVEYVVWARDPGHAWKKAALGDTLAEEGRRTKGVLDRHVHELLDIDGVTVKEDDDAAV